MNNVVFPFVTLLVAGVLTSASAHAGPIVKEARAEVKACIKDAKQPGNTIEFEVTTVSTCFVSGFIREVSFYAVSKFDGTEEWVATVQFDCDNNVTSGECAVDDEVAECVTDDATYVAGDVWADECNTCGCGDDGLIWCTRMYCGPSKYIELP